MRPGRLNPGIARVSAWLAEPAPAERLAAFRILVGTFAVGYLLVRLPAYLDAARMSDGEWDPVGVLAWMSGPLPASVVQLAVAAVTMLGLAFAGGARFRVVGPAFAVGLLLVTTYRSSGGRVLYFENLMVLHALVVGCSPAADVWRIGSAHRRREPSSSYGWPLRLCALITATTYVLAGVAKLRLGGPAWIGGDSLRNHVAYSAARLRLLGGTPSPFAGPIIDWRWVSTPAALATLALELAAPVALLGRRWRTAWVIGIWSLHAGIALTMFVVFPYPLLLVAFAPLFRLERLGPRVSS